MTPENIVYLDVALLKTLTAKVMELEAQVAALRRDLTMVRSNAVGDVMYLLAQVAQRLPARVDAMIREERRKASSDDHAAKPRTL
jgi:hypothetical protein